MAYDGKWEEGLRFMADAYAKVSSVRDVQCPRSIVCFTNLIYANRINSRGMSRVFCEQPTHYFQENCLRSGNLLYYTTAEIDFRETVEWQKG